MRKVRSERQAARDQALDKLADAARKMGVEVLKRMHPTVYQDGYAVAFCFRPISACPMVGGDGACNDRQSAMAWMHGYWAGEQERSRV